MFKSVVVAVALVATVVGLPIHNLNNFAQRNFVKKDGLRVVESISGNIADASVTFDRKVFATVIAGDKICGNYASDGSSLGCISDSNIVGGCQPGMGLVFYCFSGATDVTAYHLDTLTKVSHGSCSGSIKAFGGCATGAEATSNNVDLVKAGSKLTVSSSKVSYDVDTSLGSTVADFSSLAVGFNQYVAVVATSVGYEVVDLDQSSATSVYTATLSDITSCQASTWSTGADTMIAVCCVTDGVNCAVYSKDSQTEVKSLDASMEDASAIMIMLDDVIVAKDSQLVFIDGLISSSLSVNDRTTTGTSTASETFLIAGGDAYAPIRILSAGANGAKIIASCDASESGCERFTNLDGGAGDYGVPVLIASVLALTIIPSSIYAYRQRKLCQKPISKADQVEVNFDTERGIHYDPAYEAYAQQFEQSRKSKNRSPPEL